LVQSLSIAQLRLPSQVLMDGALLRSLCPSCSCLIDSQQRTLARHYHLQWLHTYVHFLITSNSNFDTGSHSNRSTYSHASNVTARSHRNQHRDMQSNQADSAAVLEN